MEHPQEREAEDLDDLEPPEDWDADGEDDEDEDWFDDEEEDDDWDDEDEDELINPGQ